MLSQRRLQMAGDPATTTAEAVIARAVRSVCSDGNADAKGVARDVVRALEQAGFEIVPPKPFNDWARIG